MDFEKKKKEKGLEEKAERESSDSDKHEVELIEYNGKEMFNAFFLIAPSANL